MLSQFFAITIFIIKCDKNVSPTLSGNFRKSLSESMTNRNCYHTFGITITKYNKNLFQSVTGITKCDKKSLQSVNRYYIV